jgi:hypothetical protein
MVHNTTFCPLDSTGPKPTGRFCAWLENCALGTVFAILGTLAGLLHPTGGFVAAVVVGSATVEP